MKSRIGLFQFRAILTRQQQRQHKNRRWRSKIEFFFSKFIQVWYTFPNELFFASLVTCAYAYWLSPSCQRGCFVRNFRIRMRCFSYLNTVLLITRYFRLKGSAENWKESNTHTALYLFSHIWRENETGDKKNNKLFFVHNEWMKF